MDKGHSTGKVYVVDDDAAVRQTVGLILSRSGFDTIGLSDGASLLRMMRCESPHCVLLDLKLAGETGLDILKQLRADGHATPVLMISGAGSIAEAVAALKLGADDFIQKPFSGDELTGKVTGCIASHAAARTAEFKAPRLSGNQPLTRREQQVMALCVKGATAKETAIALGLSPRTVEDHRANLMRKLGARNAADLVRIVLAEAAA